MSGGYFQSKPGETLAGLKAGVEIQPFQVLGFVWRPLMHCMMLHDVTTNFWTSSRKDITELDSCTGRRDTHCHLEKSDYTLGFFRSPNHPDFTL